MDNICKICNNEFSEKSHFWKCHRIKEADYYQKYYPRIDLFSKEIITFKSYESYQLTDFNDRRNLKKYLEQLSNEESINYCKQWLMSRKEIKNLEFAPTEFEIKSLMFPPIKYLEEKYGHGTYQNICNNLNLKLSYNYESIPQFTSLKNNYICDSREQNLLKLPNIQIKKLDFGDYSIEGSNIFIERKSLNDLVGTMSSGYERFIREIQRCQDNLGSQLIVLIEEKYQNIMSFNYLPHMKYTKCSPDFILHRIRELLNKFPYNLQFLSVDGRKESVRVMDKIFNLNCLNTFDLQYLYDRKML